MRPGRSQQGLYAHWRRTTALGTGERRKKYDLWIAAYGTLEEVNVAIGVARLRDPSQKWPIVTRHVPTEPSYAE
jgi:hypothetical protein